jgi:hypothetical protein
MPEPQWKRTSNRIARRRIERIRWTRQDKIGVLLIGALLLLVSAASAWLVANFHD